MNINYNSENAERRTQNAERRTQNAERRTQNAERRLDYRTNLSSSQVFSIESGVGV